MPNFAKIDQQLAQAQVILKKLRMATDEQLAKQGKELKAFVKEKLLEVAVEIAREE